MRNENNTAQSVVFNTVHVVVCTVYSVFSIVKYQCVELPGVRRRKSPMAGLCPQGDQVPRKSTKHCFGIYLVGFVESNNVFSHNGPDLHKI